MQFTVYLPEHKIRVEYPKDQFMSLYPNSLIGLVLSNTADAEVPLSHPLVTPEGLKIVSRIILDGVYPILNESHRKVFDYLGMDLPDFVYTPVYKEFMEKEGRSSMTLKDLMNKEYDALFAVASKYKLKSLLEYIFRSTKASDTLISDSTGFLNLITMVPHSSVLEDLAILTYTNRGIQSRLSIEPLDISKIKERILLNGYPTLYRLVLHDHGEHIMSNVRLLIAIIEAIGKNPSHFKGYDECIDILSVSRVDMLGKPMTFLENRIYTMARTWNPEMINQLGVRVPRDRTFYKDILSGLLWTMIIRNNPQAYIAFLEYLLSTNTYGVMPSFDGFHETCSSHMHLISEDMRLIFPPPS